MECHTCFGGIVGAVAASATEPVVAAVAFALFVASEERTLPAAVVEVETHHFLSENLSL